MNIDNLLKYFALGSMGALLAVLLHWLVMSAYVDVPFLEFKPTLMQLYAGMVWGGISAWIYAFEVISNWIIRGVIFSILPATFQLAHEYGVMGGNLLDSVTNSVSGDFLSKVLFREESWAWIGCYAIAWGLVTSYTISKK